MAEGAAGGLAGQSFYSSVAVSLTHHHSFVVAVPGSLYLNRRWAYYRRLPITIKVLGVVLVTAPAIAAQAERRGVQYDKEHNWYVFLRHYLHSFIQTILFVSLGVV